MLVIVLLVVAVILVIAIAKNLSGPRQPVYYDQPPIVEPVYVEPMYIEPNPLAEVATIAAAEVVADVAFDAFESANAPDPGMFDDSGFDGGGGFDSGGF